MAIISSHDAGEKIIEIANNLEKNRKLNERRNSLIKSQKYKIFFLGSMTSIFLGIISGLAPLFATFISLIREISISNTTLNIIPFSLYVISLFSIYFISDICMEKFSFKPFIFSSLAYIFAYFGARFILYLIL